MAVTRKSRTTLSLVVDNPPPRPRQRKVLPVETPPPAPVRAELPALSADMTVAAACHAVLKSCFAHLLENRLPVLKNDDPEAVHQARVALRRLRAAIVVFRRIVPGEALQLLGEDARWLANEMGPVRDLDVFIDEIFGPVARALPEENGMAAWRVTARTLQVEARERARSALRSRRFRLWRERFTSWLSADIAPALGTASDSDTTGPVYRPVAGFAAEVLERRDRQARRHGRHLGRLPTAERHELRLRLKKLRYAAEFFASAFPEREVGRYVKRLTRLQNGLGYLNDQAVAQPLMARIERQIAQASPDLAADARHVSGLITGWHAARQADNEDGLRRAWKRFEATTGFWHRE